MPLTNSAGERIYRCTAPTRCMMQGSTAGGTQYATTMHQGEGYGGRVLDTKLAQEAATTLRRGNPVTVGMNHGVGGVVGVGTAWYYRPFSNTNGRHGIVTSIVKYDQVSNKNLGMFRLSDEADRLYSDILQTLRHPSFRVIAFGDVQADRSFSQIHPHNIQYTAPVDKRLTHIPVGQLACVLNHARPTGGHLQNLW